MEYRCDFKQVSMSGTLCDSLSSSSSSSVMPLGPSPPFVGYVDLYGKRRQAARVQVLEREIGLLQDEIKSLGGIGFASGSCKELDDFIDSTPDPLIAMSRNLTSSKSKKFVKILGRKFSCLSWMCCFCGTCYLSHISSCCCDVKKLCSWRLCKCCKISCGCSFDSSCPKCSVCFCNPCPCF